ncbi:MAG: FAD-binding oxidoreductase, partial [Candidatus Spyradenecus sp.]
MTDCVAELLSIRPLAQGYQVLTLHAPELAAEAQPGQFVHLQVPTLEPSRLRRPFSIYDAEPESGRLYILYKVVGFGTARLAAVTPGTKLNILGPIGRPFPLDPAGTPYLVGGGYGVAPLWFLSRKLPRKGVLFVGGRTAADILEVDRFREAGWEVRVATQDGSLGEQG